MVLLYSVKMSKRLSRGRESSEAVAQARAVVCRRRALGGAWWRKAVSVFTCSCISYIQLCLSPKNCNFLTDHFLNTRATTHGLCGIDAAGVENAVGFENRRCRAAPSSSKGCYRSALSALWMSSWLDDRHDSFEWLWEPSVKICPMASL